MALYLDGFAGNLQGLESSVPYLQELGVNMIHVMPILESPPEASDGGYAISDFRNINKRAGTLEELTSLASKLRRRHMLLTLDVVVNHASNQHEWTQRARRGEQTYIDYFYIFDNRDIPDLFEETMVGSRCGESWRCPYGYTT